MKRSLTFSLLLLLSSTICRGEIEKIAIPSQDGLNLLWWPKVNPPPGFVFDQAVSHQTAVKMFIPIGCTFSNAETVIYAKAAFKPGIPDVKTLQALIENDVVAFRQRDPNLIVQSGPAIKDGDAKQAIVFTFAPSGSGNWESVAYSEEGEFYLLFTLSSRSKKGYEASLPLFTTMIASYHK
ncbi:hypothetical protein [Geothrix sp. 21YS21S-2]|uniref:hypothetical protein n=1 Tax=Geothrix sp. 21YS21S-2 TaxID=3068893 RepID=UPI0027BAB949|nr:hypothetical protein [Geothrix sp. 21YS21S-2]